MTSKMPCFHDDKLKKRRLLADNTFFMYEEFVLTQKFHSFIVCLYHIKIRHISTLRITV